MSTTPPETPFFDSWVDLSAPLSTSTSPLRVTPIPFVNDQDYLRMLREAQRESIRGASNKVSPISSALMSLSSTTRNTPSHSPKSPPNSPNPELAAFAEDMKGVHINRPSRSSVSASDLIWDWNSRPNIPPKEWKLTGSANRSRKSSSGNRANYTSPERKGKTFFSKEVVVTLVLTNLLSLLIGAGIGLFLSKKGTGDNLLEIPI